MLKQKRIILWQNISAAIPKLGESMCIEECGKGNVPDREGSTSKADLSQLWRNTERGQKSKSLFEKFSFSKKRAEKLTSYYKLHSMHFNFF